jgi:hypothetical protein
VPAWAVVAAVSLLVLAVYLPRLDDVAGLIIDDAWYVQLAKSLAEGQGYFLANSPSPGLVPTFPPGFAALLSVAFLLDPQFPQNVVLLKSVSIAAMFGVGIVSYRYFTRYRALSPQLALGLACAIVVTPAFVFLATSSVMSECVFTLAQLGAVVLADKSLTRDRHYRWTLLAAATAAAAVLIRSAGVPLVAAIVLILLTRRQWRRALFFCAAVACCLAPWTWFARTHEPTREERLAHGGTQAFSYREHYALQWAGRPSFGTISARELPARVVDGLVDVFARDVAAIVTPVLFRDARESGQEVIAVAGGRYPASMGSAPGTMAVSLVLSGVAFLGFLTVARKAPTTAEFLVPLSIGMIVLWPHPAIRYVLPLAPFLFFYLLRGLETLTRSGTASRIAILIVIGLNLLDHGQYALARRAGVVDWAAEAREADAVLTWMRDNLPAEGYIATTNPALVYLRTGRRTVAIDDPPANWWKWKKHGVRYLVCLRPTSLPAETGPYTVLYRSPRQGFWVVEI